MAFIRSFSLPLYFLANCLILSSLEGARAMMSFISSLYVFHILEIPAHITSVNIQQKGGKKKVGKKAGFQGIFHQTIYNKFNMDQEPSSRENNPSSLFKLNRFLEKIKSLIEDNADGEILNDFVHSKMKIFQYTLPSATVKELLDFESNHKKITKLTNKNQEVFKKQIFQKTLDLVKQELKKRNIEDLETHLNRQEIALGSFQILYIIVEALLIYMTGCQTKRFLILGKVLFSLKLILSVLLVIFLIFRIFFSEKWAKKFFSQQKKFCHNFKVLLARGFLGIVYPVIMVLDLALQAAWSFTTFGKCENQNKVLVIVKAFIALSLLFFALRIWRTSFKKIKKKVMEEGKGMKLVGQILKKRDQVEPLASS